MNRKKLTQPLRLALIGMSGAGKSHWTRKLAAGGCATLSCDDGIERHLHLQLAAEGHAGIAGVAAWMNWPDSPHYAEREAQYLAAEIAVLNETLAELESNPDRGLVLDTTGSVIHTGVETLRRLRKNMLVVYLAVSPEDQQILMERYLRDPKPVLWRGMFQPQAGESPLETVRRCYPALIAARTSQYQALAQCTIPLGCLWDLAMGAQGFLSLIERQWEQQEFMGA